jgi:hypothetical protein
MDAISNGLDASTTFDILAAFKVAVKILKITNVTSLLQVNTPILFLIVSSTFFLLLSSLPCQPSPEVFNLFDDIILMSEGYVIFHGTPPPPSLPPVPDEVL